MKHLLIILPCMILLTILSAFAQSDENFSSVKDQSEVLQKINVTVGGDFIVNGSFTASRMQRVDHFITTLSIISQEKALASLNQLELIKLVQKELHRFALRDIRLKRAKGGEIKIDLLKYRMTGDITLNPYLMNDDVIIFPSFDLDKNFIDINGAVNKPTKFQYVEGDKLSDALLFAGGINTSYDSVSTAIISRLDNTGMKEELITVGIKDDITLHCGDRIRVQSAENQRKSYQIQILGEVRFPGYVYIAKEGSQIHDVIKKAGGFTSNADLRKARVIRDYTSGELLQKEQLSKEYFEMQDLFRGAETMWKAIQQRKTLEIMRLTNLTLDDSLYFGIDNQLRVLQSESLVDFTKIDDANSDESKFLVKEGDLVVVPEKFDYVYVFGQVLKAGYVKYTPGKDFTYYIRQSGGSAETARGGESDIAVIKGNSMTWVTKDKEDLTIEPGDYIYVPKSVPVTTWMFIRRISDVLQILGSAATIILLLIQFSK